jgi:kynurenine formamidase
MLRSPFHPPLLLLPFVILLAGCGPGAPGDTDATGGATFHALLSGARLVELTHPLNEETLVWPTEPPFRFDTTAHGWTEGGYYYSSRHFSGPEHGGTHLDAPIHFAEGRWTTEQIPLERLMGPAVVVDVSREAREDPGYQVTVEDLTRWEDAHGLIPDGAILLLFTDRSRFWPDAERYLGTAERGEAGVAALRFPGLHPEAARWLVENRNVAAVGLDTPSLDHGQSTAFETHRVLMEENIYGLENVANLEALPPVGATVLALPMLMEGGTGGPVRIVGVLP